MASHWRLPDLRDFHGRVVHYGQRGQKAPLVMVHGTPGSSCNIRTARAPDAMRIHRQTSWRHPRTRFEPKTRCAELAPWDRCCFVAAGVTAGFISHAYWRSPRANRHGWKRFTETFWSEELRTRRMGSARSSCMSCATSGREAGQCSDRGTPHPPGENARHRRGRGTATGSLQLEGALSRLGPVHRLRGRVSLPRSRSASHSRVG